MKVLFAVWELAPFFQVGGLGDVARSLPKSLYSQGIDIRIILPYYKALKLFKIKRELVKKFAVIYNGKKERVSLFKIHFLDSDLPVYLIKNDAHLDIPLKGTFAFLNLTIYQIVKENYLNWQPDIIHCNDYHTALIPFLAKHRGLKCKTLLTIHNIDHQGKTSIDAVQKIGLDHIRCRVIHWEIKKRQINFLLEGIIHADLVNTVSPTYAKEIMTEEYGAGLDEITRNERDKIYGILNGIDYDTRCPLKDKNILHHYTAEKVNEKLPYILHSPIVGKRLNKEFLQEKLNFDVNDKIPLIGFIGRLDGWQKGLDIMHKMIRRINLDKFQFVILGQGNVDWTERLQWLTSFYQKSVAFIDKFDNRLASQIYAASDFLLVPSRFEPCGLIQMIAMRYGTLPIARSTGGLKDSIENGVDGFLFKKYTSYDLEKTLKKAVHIWKNDKEKMAKMIEAAMTKDFSWNKSAVEYINLYKKLVPSV